MDEMKSTGKEKTKEEVALSEEQKTEIRREMAKPMTKKEAQEFRKFLATWYRVSAQTIAGISAYKENPDGTLTLRPFGSLPTALADETPELTTESTNELQAQPLLEPQPAESKPHVEAHYDNATKREWRVKIREAIEATYSKEQLSNARVICLAGEALQEVTDIYIPLGIRPENIVCIEREPRVVASMKLNNETLVRANILSGPIPIFEGTVEQFLKGPHTPITIASFDYLGPLHDGFMESIKQLRAVDQFMIITNFQRRREQKQSQDVLTGLARIKRSIEFIEQAKTKYPRPRVGSEEELISQMHLANIALSGQEIAPVPLSDARDEGMAMTLIGSVVMGRIEHAAEELYREVNRAPPFESQHARVAFIRYATRYLSTAIEQEIQKRPRLSERLGVRADRNQSGRLVHFSEKGKRGFLRNFASVIDQSLAGVSIGGLKRYEYASEDNGTPFQTDIAYFMDWKHRFRQYHQEAYEFIRESFRILGDKGQADVSIQFEVSGKVLPQNYSDSTAKVMVCLCIGGKPRLRIPLRNLQQLVSYYQQNEAMFDVASTGELFAQPRTKIKTE